MDLLREIFEALYKEFKGSKSDYMNRFSQACLEPHSFLVPKNIIKFPDKINDKVKGLITSIVIKKAPDFCMGA